MSRSDVVRRLRALASRGVPMSVRHLLPAHAELVGRALATFGGFDRARAIAGLEAPSIPHDRDVVTAALRGLARNGVRLDATTLSTMGEAALVTACVDTFGGVPDAVAAAGLGAVPVQEPPRRPAPDVRPGVRPDVRNGGRREAGFAQPAISADGQVPTEQALEVLQQTAVTLGRVPAARDLPPDVARRLTSEYGSVRFAYLALRVHSADEAGATAADEPIARVSPEAFAATARLPGSAAQNRRNVEAARDEAAASARVATVAQVALVVPVVPVVPALDGDQVAALFEELDARIDEGAAAAAVQLTTALTAALEAFVDEVTALARRHTLESLLPFTEDEDEDERDDDEDDDENTTVT